jgi:hypothetical protein
LVCSIGTFTISDVPVRASRVARVSHDELEAMLMLRQMTDMPVGTIGFEAVGEVEDDDWEDTVEPVFGRRSPKGARCGCCTCWARGRPRSRPMP